MARSTPGWAILRFRPTIERSARGWLSPRFAYDYEFKETEHKRDDDGKFTSNGSSKSIFTETPSIDELKKRAVEHRHNLWKGNKIKDDPTDHEPTETEIEEWTVNYVRHELTDYDVIRTTHNKSELTKNIRLNVMSAIADQWPELRKESLAYLQRKHPDLELLPSGTPLRTPKEFYEKYERDQEAARKKRDEDKRLEDERKARDREERRIAKALRTAQWKAEHPDAADGQPGWASPRF